MRSQDLRLTALRWKTPPSKIDQLSRKPCDRKVYGSWHCVLKTPSKQNWPVEQRTLRSQGLRLPALCWKTPPHKIDQLSRKPCDHKVYGSRRCVGRPLPSKIDGLSREPCDRKVYGSQRCVGRPLLAKVTGWAENLAIARSTAHGAVLQEH